MNFNIKRIAVKTFANVTVVNKSNTFTSNSSCNVKIIIYNKVNTIRTNIKVIITAQPLHLFLKSKCSCKDLFKTLASLYSS